MKILVTGAAGFIGYHVSKRLLERGDEVIGIDNLNDYYDPRLKEARLGQLEPSAKFRFLKMDIADRAAMERLFADHTFDRVIHLAAQAGVRYSLTNPHAYVHSNVVGFLNVLEGCRRIQSTLSLKGDGRGEGDNPSPIPFHLVYASSSSVYGSNTKLPFSTSDNVDHPISLYAATKKADELMAHTYSHLYGLPTTGLRFFTVYGPWGRPDMALFKFTKAILEGEPIDVYNEGRMRRDFTYIDDIVEGVVRVTDHIPGRDQGSGIRDQGSGIRDQGSESADHRSPITGHDVRGTDHRSPITDHYKIYNIGNHSPVELLEFIKTLETALGKTARVNLLPMQPGDVAATYADVEDLSRDVGFAPKTPISHGIEQFVKWYREYYRC